MPKVTATLQQLLTSKIKGELLGAERIMKIMAELKRQVLVELATAPGGSFGTARLQQTLAAIDAHLATWETRTRSEAAGLLESSWEAGKELLPAMAEAAGMQVGRFWISTAQLDALKDFALGRFAHVRTDASARIRAEVTLGILGQKTPQEVTAAVAGELGSPSIFKSIEARAETITKTEMGRAYSMATQKSLEASTDVLPELQKMWLHAGHPKRARIYHLNIHGLTVPIAERFLVGNIGMMYPRDPTAPASEVINCGCTHVPYMAEWGSKKEFLTSWDKAQKAANSRKGA
ncbi:hypothetical protein [Geobacter sp.]|uniref:hypothetical protein n=1 Tax=Geobacter sp. TaxID=46610 RepID=UPI00262BDCD5|nr:hypothetical protein [Geobacter sp.]